MDEKEKKIEENPTVKSIAAKKTKKFMKSVNAFLASNNGGEVAEEWQCSLMLLETYYNQFVQLSEEIDRLPSLTTESRYGVVPHPLLAAQAKAAMRLEQYMKELGITFKAAIKLNLNEVKPEESVLEQFVKGKIEKR